MRHTKKPYKTLLAINSKFFKTEFMRIKSPNFYKTVKIPARLIAFMNAL